MDGEVGVVLAAVASAAAVRLAPELLLRGRAPPRALAAALPWLPAIVCGAMVGVLHMGAPAPDRVPYVVAAVPAALMLLWKRSFYLPVVVGAAALALLRAAGWAAP